MVEKSTSDRISLKNLNLMKPRTEIQTIPYIYIYIYLFIYLFIYFFADDTKKIQVLKYQLQNYCLPYNTINW